MNVNIKILKTIPKVGEPVVNKNKVIANVAM